MTFVYSILGGLTLLIGGFSLCLCGQYPVIGAELYSAGSASAWLGFAVLIIPQVVRLFGQVMPHPTAEQDAQRVINRLGLQSEYRKGKPGKRWDVRLTKAYAGAITELLADGWTRYGDWFVDPLTGKTHDIFDASRISLSRNAGSK